MPKNLNKSLAAAALTITILTTLQSVLAFLEPPEMIIGIGIFIIFFTKSISYPKPVPSLSIEF